MFKALKNLFDDNAKDIKKYNKRVEEINALESAISTLSDDELKAKTPYFKEKLAGGVPLTISCPKLLPWYEKHPSAYWECVTLMSSSSVAWCCTTAVSRK